MPVFILGTDKMLSISQETIGKLNVGASFNKTATRFYLCQECKLASCVKSVNTHIIATRTECLFHRQVFPVPGPPIFFSRPSLEAQHRLSHSDVNSIIPLDYRMSPNNHRFLKGLEQSETNLKLKIIGKLKVALKVFYEI